MYDCLIGVVTVVNRATWLMNSNQGGPTICLLSWGRRLAASQCGRPAVRIAVWHYIHQSVNTGSGTVQRGLWGTYANFWSIRVGGVSHLLEVVFQTHGCHAWRTRVKHNEELPMKPSWRSRKDKALVGPIEVARNPAYRVYSCF